MAAACASIGMNTNTFIKHAKRLGVYNPNQAGKGISKPNGTKIPLKDIIEGKHPQYQTSKLRIRLISEKIKKKKCEKCGYSKWNNKKIPLELHHIDGNSHNHLLTNLKILCPNCHAQTDNFGGKNIKT